MVDLAPQRADRPPGLGARIGAWLRPLLASQPLAAVLRPWASLARMLEAEQDRWFLWLPVLLGLGIGLYFWLPAEPAAGVAPACLLAAAGLTRLRPDGTLGRVVSGALLTVAIGFCAATVRSSLVAAPVLAYDAGVCTVLGHVEAVEARGQRAYRVTIRVAVVEGLEPPPYRVRVRTVTGSRQPLVGEAVRVRARLSPPPLPALVGDYDFARRAYFLGLGAVGFARSGLEPAPGLGAAPVSIRIWAPVENLRGAIAARVAAVLPGDRGAIATALLQGDQGAISDRAMAVMRDSGLAHILSISGLHMVIMAGALFWTIRALLALSPMLSQRYPVRQIAAIAAAAGALVYLLLSGCQVPAVRSFVMLLVMFLAIVAGRPALSLRNVAIAALLLLTARPENVHDVSFLMSFAATIGLVALYEGMARRRADRLDEGGGRGGVFRWAAAIIAADVLTTLVASLAVAPLGVFFFHKLQHYSVLANLLALPVVGLWLMPLVLLTLLAMPLGLDGPVLWAMGQGVDVLLLIAAWVAGLPGSVSALPAIPPEAVLLMMLGGLWGVLWRHRWRWLALPLMAGGLLATGGRARPDALIGREAATVAVRGADGRLEARVVRGAGFELARWLEHDGDGRPAVAAATGRGFHCDGVACRFEVRGLPAALVGLPEGLERACREARLVVVRFAATGACPGNEAQVIDAFAVQVLGTHEIRVRDGQLEVATVAGSRGARPWSRPAPSALSMPSRTRPLAERGAVAGDAAARPWQRPAEPEAGEDR